MIWEKMSCINGCMVISNLVKCLRKVFNYCNYLKFFDISQIKKRIVSAQTICGSMVTCSSNQKPNPEFTVLICFLSQNLMFVLILPFRLLLRLLAGKEHSICLATSSSRSRGYCTTKTRFYFNKGSRN